MVCIFSPILFSVHCKEDSIRRWEKGQRPKYSHSRFGHCGGGTLFPLIVLMVKPPKARERKPIQRNGRLYSTMGDGCYSFCGTRWEHCPYPSDLILPGLSSFTVLPDQKRLRVAPPPPLSISTRWEVSILRKSCMPWVDFFSSYV